MTFLNGSGELLPPSPVRNHKQDPWRNDSCDRDILVSVLMDNRIKEEDPDQGRARFVAAGPISEGGNQDEKEYNCDVGCGHKPDGGIKCVGRRR